MKRFTPPRNKSGFTLAELLIVVAIIAVLIAIAIPVFSSQLKSSREAVDKANERSAESMAASTYLMYGGSGDITFSFGMNDKSNLGIFDVTLSSTDPIGAFSVADAETLIKDSTFEDNQKYNEATDTKRTSAKGFFIKVTINGGAVTECEWEAGRKPTA